MTRDKYYDNVQASLSAAFAGESKEFIAASLKAFEGFCSPQENPVYGKYFPEVAEWIGQKRMVLPHKMNDDELSEFYEELKEMYEVLEQIEEYFSCILHDINSLILILYLSYSFKDLTEGSASYALCPRVREPQLSNPVHLGPVLFNKRSQQEDPHHNYKVSPALCN